ncbi:hypothetical protein BDV59DRAFT_186662 [Aspergillus ambiguus]|uniref:uncharacterized protein n=1 Tax=Aspergillus ambiguus TaxID=176160 RepID=UPI003CCD3D1F
MSLIFNNGVSPPIHQLSCTMSDATPSHWNPLSLIRSKSSKSEGHERQKPSYPPEQAETKSSKKVKPHRIRLLNKLDPRFNQDLLDAKARGELGDI